MSHVLRDLSLYLGASGRTATRREYLDTRTLPPFTEGVPATKEPGGWGVPTNGAHAPSSRGPLPPTSALLRRAQEPSSRKREDSQNTRTATRVSPSVYGGSTGDVGAGEGGAFPPTALIA
jgi:hypothetical protein